MRADMTALGQQRASHLSTQYPPIGDPHSAIDGKSQGTIINLADKRAERSRHGQLKLLASLGPDRIATEFARIEAPPAPSSEQPLIPHLIMPDRHDVRSEDVISRRLHAALAAAADSGPKDFPDLLLTPGVGARTVQALAIVAEVVHGAPCRFSDPARYSLAHGGKDRHPYPVPLKVYDETINVLKSAVRKAKIGREEELGAIKRLDEQARRLDATARGLSSTRSSPMNSKIRIVSAAGAFSAGSQNRLSPGKPNGPADV